MIRLRNVAWTKMSAVGTVLVAVATLAPVPTPAVAAEPLPPSLVSTVPAAGTPMVQDQRVNTIYDAGSKVIAGGMFSTVRSGGTTTNLIRNRIFAFDRTSGAVETAFAPVVDGEEVTAIIGGPTPGTVYLAGRFTEVSGVPRSKIALLSVADGAVLATFRGPAINGLVSDIALANGHLLVGGNFTQAQPLGGVATPRNGLLSLNATTGLLDAYLTAGVAVNHNWTPGSLGAKAPVGADKIAVSPDGTQLVVIGNFKRITRAGLGDAVRDQVARFSLGATAAELTDWVTDRYVPACYPTGFDSYVRDVAFAPNGSYFAVVTSGGGFPGTLCDSVARWDTAQSGPGRQPTWVIASGGDSILSVAVGEHAVYVGGHFRWLNNPLANGPALAGAVARPSIAALDPATGLPYAWNPGRNPRGYGITELHLTPAGLWVGHDQEWFGNQEHKRDRIAFFPLDGGSTPHPSAVPATTRDVYQFGRNAPNRSILRINAGGPALTSVDGGPNWAADSNPSPYRVFGPGSVVRSAVIGAVQAPPVPLTTPRPLFNSELFGRSTAPNIQWNLPIAKGTPVQVRAYFSSRCACAVGSRTFNVTLDGVRKLTNFDITAAAGNETGTMRAWNITSDGNIDLDLGKVVNYPIINGIEVVRMDLPATNGTENQVWTFPYAGGSPPVGVTVRADPSNTPWGSAQSGFWVGGTLFYAISGTLWRRAFDGMTFGPATVVDPYHSEKWDAVLTMSDPVGQTYRGAASTFTDELSSVTGMMYRDGRLYYTGANFSGLAWRWFNPDSGIVGGEKFTVTVPATTGSYLSRAGGMFLSDGILYVVLRDTGALVRMTWNNGAPVLLDQVPGTKDWRTRLLVAL